MDIKLITYLIILLFYTIPVSRAQNNASPDTHHNVELKSGIAVDRRPVDMLHQNCSECHEGSIYSSYLYSLTLDTIKSGDRLIHAWISCATVDQTREMHITAGGINNFKDTLPAVGAMGLVYLESDSGWQLISAQPFFTDDNGEAVFQIQDGFRGDSSGYIRLLVKLADDRSYPNARVRLRRKWGTQQAAISGNAGGIRNERPLKEGITGIYLTAGSILFAVFFYVIHSLVKISHLVRKIYHRP